MAILTVCYIFMVKNGKKWMGDRKPFQLDRLIILYNAAQIVLNAALCLAVCIFIAHSDLNKFNVFTMMAEQSMEFAELSLSSESRLWHIDIKE